MSESFGRAGSRETPNAVNKVATPGLVGREESQQRERLCGQGESPSAFWGSFVIGAPDALVRGAWSARGRRQGGSVGQGQYLGWGFCVDSRVRS